MDMLYDILPAVPEIRPTDVPPNANFVPWDTPVSKLRVGYSLLFVRLRTSRLCQFNGVCEHLDPQTYASITVLHKDFGFESGTVSAVSGPYDIDEDEL